MGFIEEERGLDRFGSGLFKEASDLVRAKGEDEPREIYFRDDAETTFGMLRFERLKDNPYRDFNAITNKIMNTKPFRTSLLDNETASVWSKGWK